MFEKLKELVGNVAASIFTAIYKLPQPARLLLRDILEGAAAAIATVTFFVPQDVEEAKKLAVTVFIALSAAVVAVIRRYVWKLVIDKLGDDPGTN